KNDTLRGTAKADKIYGKAGNDKLYGLGGNDYLNGGPGNDTLTGGPGADRYVCGPGRDTVVGDSKDVAAKDCEVVKGIAPPPPPPANVVPGLYCGFTNQGKSICFTVTPDRRSFSQAHFGARADCQPDYTFDGTIDFPGTTPIAPDGSFTYTVQFMTPDSKIGGLVGSYVRGKIDSAGNAQGEMHMTAISFTSSGTSYSCETADTTWTAKKQ
ncbi:MAG: hypothetical protein ACXVY8_03405, partial [Gaiellaceae bacterium]